jgi:hypothetical protein
MRVQLTGRDLYVIIPGISESFLADGTGQDESCGGEEGVKGAAQGTLSFAAALMVSGLSAAILALCGASLGPEVQNPFGDSVEGDSPAFRGTSISDVTASVSHTFGPGCELIMEHSCSPDCVWGTGSRLTGSRVTRGSACSRWAGYLISHRVPNEFAYSALPAADGRYGPEHALVVGQDQAGPENICMPAPAGQLCEQATLAGMRFVG